MDPRSNSRFPGQPPGNFGPGMMHPGPGQQVMPGSIPRYPMMQPGMLMSRPMMQQQQMYQMQMMGMRPAMPPPSYNQAMSDSTRARNPNAARSRQPLSPASQRKLEQQQKLKHFSKGAPVSADKLIESMFGKTEKPKPKPAQNLQETSSSQDTNKDYNDDEGFGDFLGGPASSSQSSNGTTEREGTPPNQSVSSTVEAPNAQTADQDAGANTQKEDKKDLMKMMMECSDLNAPLKAKTFHKPALKDLHPTHHSSHTFQESKQAHQWRQEEDLTEMFTVKVPAQPAPQPTPVRQSPDTATPPPKFELPAWCKDDSKVPIVYSQVYEASHVDEVILTERLYPILLMSGLPKETLGQIWSLANQTSPGQLTKPELYLALALIAFAQNNYTSLSMEVLHKCPYPPVPFLGQQSQGPHPSSSASPLQGNPPESVSSINTPQVTSISQSVAPPSGPMPVVPPSGPMPVAPPAGQVSMPHSGTTTLTSSSVQPHGQAGAISASTPAVLGTGNTCIQPGGNFMEDDFEDFQAAPPPVSFVDPKTRIEPQEKKLKRTVEEPEYLYSVPTPDVGELPHEHRHSNVRNFFGSDDSSDGSTVNSIDGDFDDFKSADSKPSDSSQFTSSEQSENEDFKAFESYLDDFNRKKSELESKQESPLHKPIPKFSGTMSSQLPGNAKMTNIPAIKSLWNKDDKHRGKIDSSEKESIPKLGISPPKSSDSDFADFQQAPVVVGIAEEQKTSKTSGTDACLIGEEDKYAALRAFDAVPVATIFDSKSAEGLTEEVSPHVETDEDSWADFQAVSVDASVQSEPKDKKDTILSLYSMPDVDNKPGIIGDKSGDFQWQEGSENATKSNTDWSSLSESNTTNVDKSDENFGWSNFTATTNVVEDASQGADDWADFQGGSAVIEDTDMKESETQSNLVQIKKQNLNTTEILGLFKVRDDPPSDLKLQDNKPSHQAEKLHSSEKMKTPSTTSVPRSKPKYSPGLDDHDDPFRIPPPMDDCHDDHEDEYGEFSRGYDLDDVIRPPGHSENRKKNLYSFYGMDAPEEKAKSTSTKQIEFKLQEPGLSKSDSNNDFNDTDSISSKDADGQTWPGANAVKAEDAQSVSSLDLPYPKRVQNIKEADSQSISSNEFGNFETHLKPPANPDEKSVDSLDLKRVDSNMLLEQTESGSDADQTGDTSKEGTPESNVSASDVGSSVTPHVSNIPFLGDRYSEIMEDIPSSDKHAYEWQRCLDSCSNMIKDANNIFNSISSSAVCNEVIRSDQGSEYVEGVVEIYRVVCRITTAMMSTGEVLGDLHLLGLSNEKLAQVLREIDLGWNNLTAFLVGSKMMPDDNILDFKNSLLKSDDQSSRLRACGVCLLDVDMPCKTFNREEDGGKLTYGGRQYHATCANFWLNAVDSTLPALKLPELLF